LKMRNELYLERVEREKLEEVNKAKLQFLTNASHEFKTPLSLIVGPIEKLMDCEMEIDQKNAVSLIHKSAHRLLRLTNQLLDFQKIEENQIHLNAQPLDIVNFVTEVSSTFEELAFTKKICFKIENHIENTEVWFDPDHLDKVLFNLLSNAFKFTPENGIITILIRQGTDVSLGDYMELTVMDTGNGIIPEHLPKLFNRFYQAPGSSTNPLQAGSGIGLHLVKSLVELHKGTCSVNSEINSGSSFSFRLPLGNKHLQPHEMTVAHNIPVFMGLPKAVKYSKEIVKSELEKTARSEVFRILIVEDEPEILNYLISELSDNYKIFSATNGKSGLFTALQEVPDLIISDVMMPEMDGIELCRQLKTDIQTCHIPVILLTAQSSNQNRLEGLETGADAYISKPFSIRHLHIQVSNLIELRENLKQKFSRSVFFEAKEMTVMSADEKFIQNAMDFVKANLSDPEFNIEEMGKNLGMSRVHLYRKIKALTNQSPSEFVRTIRLKQAAYILTQNKFNKSEIAYMVGFNSPQYFANCFQEYFHMTASEYIENNKTLN
ncbi:MAG: histidine kinase, partial [Daejeonella sp.]|nr:histidine kinase [Daejeonella sp.]